MRTTYKTIVISDVHLGTNGSKAKEVTLLLKHITCEKLILNGDIVDGWQLKKYGTWKKVHSQFFKRIFKLIEKNKTEIIFLRGNHDDFLDHIIPFRLGNISFKREYIHQSGNKKYYVVHGDIFDTITSNLRWIAMLGDIGYTLLLRINHIYNNYRIKKGLSYYSLSQKIKSRVKSAVSYISNFEEQLAELAKIKKCDGIICGHIHQPAIKKYGTIEYLNSGDWVESLTALAETHEGEWIILYYQDFIKEFREHASEEEFSDEEIFEIHSLHL